MLENISFIASFIALAFSILTYIANIIHDRKRDTLAAFNVLQNEALDKLNQIRPAEIQEIARHPATEEYKLVSGYIARIEHFCAGINLKIYDRETVYELAHGYFDSEMLSSRVDPIINKKHRNAIEDYYKNYHIVVEWMKSHRKKIV